MGYINLLQEFRQKLYQIIPKRRDATMDLIDALSSDHQCDSVIKLSLNKFFRRKYQSLTKVIKDFLYRDYKFTKNGSIQLVLEPCQESRQKLKELKASLCEVAKQRKFYLFGVDVTPSLRPYAKTLEDKSIVYLPNPAPGNKPIGVGHSFSVLAYLPEKTSSAPWILPLDVRRVKTEEKGHEVGLEQMEHLLTEEPTPFHQSLCMLVADSLYPTLENRERASKHENFVLNSRMKSNRNVFAPAPEGQKKKKYGEKMKLNVPETHLLSDQIGTFFLETAKGKKRCICFKLWQNLLLRGNRQFKGYLNPITLIQFEVLDAQTNEALFHKSLWIVLIGSRRHEIFPEMAYSSYAQRYDLEHFFRFGKNRLLMDKFQTPDVKHEENWWEIVQLSYIQLFLGRNIAKTILHPWERYLETHKKTQNQVGPTQVQRDFGSILEQTGTPAKEVLVRQSGKGRQKGDTLEKREPSEIIFKKSKKKDSKVKSDAKKIQKKELLRFEKKLKNLKTLNLTSVLEVVKDLLQLSDINESDFAEKLMNFAET